MSVFPSRSLPDRPFARKNAKIADSNHKLSFHSRRIPVDTGQPFAVTWKVVIVEKMLFEDCPVCHDPPSARISPSKESPPPPCRSTAGVRALSALYRITRRVHAPFGQKKITCTSKALFQFGCPTSRLQLSFISFCQLRRKLLPHRVTLRTRNQAICFITRRQWRIRHVD